MGDFYYHASNKLKHSATVHICHSNVKANDDNLSLKAIYL